MSYNSSIIFKYGDIDKVSQDIKTINDIINRQGTTFLIDLIAEHSGKTASKFKLNETDRNNLMNSLIHELNQALSERL